MRELPTTLTEESDMAAAAKAGGSSHPVHGNNSPMASGCLLYTSDAADDL